MEGLRIYRQGELPPGRGCGDRLERMVRIPVLPEECVPPGFFPIQSISFRCLIQLDCLPTGYYIFFLIRFMKKR